MQLTVEMLSAYAGKAFFFPLFSHEHKNFIINIVICITELCCDLLIHLFYTVLYKTMQILEMIHGGFYSTYISSTSARGLYDSLLVYES